MALAVLTALAVALTWRQLSVPKELSRPVVLTALRRWAFGFLGLKLVSTGVLGPGGPLGPVVSGGVHPFVSAGIGFGFALLLGSAMVDLTLRPLGRREGRWVALYGVILALPLAFATDMPKAIISLLAVPLLYRFRWRGALSGGSRLLLFLAALAALLLGIANIEFRTAAAAPEPEGLTRALGRFTAVMGSLALGQIILLLPRLLGGRIVYFRSIQRRLALSHLLVSLVPLLLAFIFWGSLTYLSVGTERARIGMRLVESESAELGAQLGAALRAAGPDDPAAIVQRLRDRYPDIRVFRQTAAGIEGLPRVAPWPDSLPDHAVVVAADGEYLGAVARPVEGGRALVALSPLRERVTTVLAGQLHADLRLHGASEVRTRGNALNINMNASNAAEPADSLRLNTPAPPAVGDSVALDRGRRGPDSEFRVSGATTLPVLRLRHDGWQRGTSLITAYVPFREAAIGIVSGLRENPFALVAVAILGFLAFLLALVENFTIRMVVSLSQSITAAVAALRRATLALQAGNLGYRIPILPEANDELWTVAQSFNTMAAGLEVARETERDRDRLEKELQLARQIQARLLPDKPPQLPGFDLAGLSYSAQQVGGDYYDFIPLTGGGVALVIADVSGKGVPASLLMSAFRASLLSQPLEGGAPGVLLERINRFLYRSVEPGRFVTAFLAFLNPQTGALLYSNAGHNPPFVIPLSEGPPRPLVAGGFMLGAFESGHWETAQARLDPGDLLVLYTDGVTEAQDEAGDFWEEERLLAFVTPRRAVACAALTSEIVAEVRRFEGQQGPSDDITLLLARRDGPTPLADTNAI